MIACLVCYRLNRQSLPFYFKYLQYLIVTAIVFELIGSLLSSINFNNNPLDHLYQPIEFGFLTLLYYHVITNAKTRLILRIMFVAFVFVALFVSFYVEGINHPNTASFILESIIVIAFAIIYIYILFSQPPATESLLANPFFWVNTANLFFYCGTFFQMGLDSYIRRKDAALADQLAIINYCLNFTLYILYGIGMLCNKIFKS